MSSTSALINRSQYSSLDIEESNGPQSNKKKFALFALMGSLVFVGVLLFATGSFAGSTTTAELEAAASSVVVSDVYACDSEPCGSGWCYDASNIDAPEALGDSGYTCLCCADPPCAEIEQPLYESDNEDFQECDSCPCYGSTGSYSPVVTTTTTSTEPTSTSSTSGSSTTTSGSTSSSTSITSTSSTTSGSSTSATTSGSSTSATTSGSTTGATSGSSTSATTSGSSDGSVSSITTTSRTAEPSPTSTSTTSTSTSGSSDGSTGTTTTTAEPTSTSTTSTSTSGSSDGTTTTSRTAEPTSASTTSTSGTTSGSTSSTTTTSSTAEPSSTSTTSSDSSASEVTGTAMDGVCVSDFEEDSKLSCGEGAMCFPGLGFEDNITLVTEDFFVNTVYDFSICFWFKTSNTDKHSLFSWATEFSQNTILFFHPKDFRVEFDKDKFPSSGKDRLNFADNLWHHTCVTYASDTGSIKMYVDNEIYAEDEDFMTGYSIENDGSITLGQEQDCVGGCFNDDDAFIGYMREVYVFNDHILDADEVASLYECDLTGVTGKPGISYEENVCSEVSDGLTGNIVNVYLDEAGWEESHG